MPRIICGAFVVYFFILSRIFITFASPIMALREPTTHAIEI